MSGIILCHYLRIAILWMLMDVPKSILSALSMEFLGLILSALYLILG
jgi:hypothetical protein